MITVQEILCALPAGDLAKLSQCAGLPVADEIEMRRALFAFFRGDLERVFLAIRSSRIRLPEAPRTEASSALATHLSLYSTRFHSGSVARLDYAILHEYLKSSHSVDIAAAFYDARFLTRLFETIPVGERALKRIRLMFNGLAGNRLKAQLEELDEFARNVLATRAETVEIRLRFEAGLFHSKLFLFRGANETAFIGSANATEAAFRINEEILLSLNTGHEALWEYFDAVWNKAVSLETLMEKEFDARTLVQFFRTGVLYFKPVTVLALNYHPFQEMLRQLSPGELARIAGISIPHAEQETGIGPFNLCLATGISGTIEEEEQSRVSVKQFAIETALGYWVPTAHQPRFESKLDEASAKKRNRYDLIAKSIKRAWPEPLTKCYGQYRSGVLEAIRKANINLAPWPIAKEPEPAESQRVFESFIDRILARLADEEYLRRMCRPFKPAAVPEIWDDPVSNKEFTESFFDYLEYAAATSSREPRISQTLRRLCRYQPSDSAVEIRAAVEETLSARGWKSDDWGAET